MNICGIDVIEDGKLKLVSEGRNKVKLEFKNMIAGEEVASLSDVVLYHPEF